MKYYTFLSSTKALNWVPRYYCTLITDFLLALGVHNRKGSGTSFVMVSQSFLINEVNLKYFCASIVSVSTGDIGRQLIYVVLSKY